MSRRSILREIRRKQQEIRVCRQVIGKVRREISTLQQQRDCWCRQQTSLSQQEMTDRVLVVKRYEGNHARFLQTAFLGRLDQKVHKEQQMETAQGSSENLIGAIERRIDQLEWEIDRLYRKLDDD